MSISISIDNDRVTAGIQSLLDDESAGVQTPISADDGNEVDVSLVAGALGGFVGAFNSFLNSNMFGSFTLSNAQKTFAATNDGASSSADFVKVTATNGETLSNLFFSDSAGNALDGDQVVGMQTLDGLNVYLWSDGDYCIATTSSTAGGGRIVAAFYLNEAVDHLTAQVQMVTFEPLSHPNGSDPDDQLNFTNVLQVSAAGSQSFDFDALKSGGCLWCAVGSNAGAVVVSGYNLDVDGAGKLDGTSNKIAVSQGGTGTTIGLNNQLFDNVGETAVFTLVTGLDSLTSADGGIQSDYIVDHTGPAAEGLNYTGYINVTGAGIFVSQSQGNSAKSFDINLFTAGGGTTPEVGFGYIGTEPHGAFDDDTPVNVATVTVRDDDGNIVATWVAGADPDGAGPLRGSGATVSGHVSGNGTANIQVTISGNNIDVNGVLGEYTVSWTSAGGVTFNRFTLVDEAGQFDVGRIDLTQGASSHQGVGGNLIVEDDGPSITASIIGAPQPTVDESNLVANDSDSFAAQFSPVYGTDGPAAAPVTYALSTPGGDSGLIDTATGNHVFLFLEAGQVVGRQGTNSGTAATGDIVFIVGVNSAGSVSLDQQRAIVHPTVDPDESKTLSSAGLVVLTGTVHDGDGDTASVPLNIGTQLIFKDDGPSITASIIGAPQPTVDESNLAANDSDSFAAQFSPVYGADGQAATPVTYALSTPGGDSGLVDTATGHHVFLFLEAGQVVGRQGTDATNAASGDIVFVVGVNSAGSVSLDQQRAIVHPTADPDETATLASAGLVVLTGTAHDKDGDSASTPLNIGTQLIFKDDGPSITASIVGAPQPTVDESNLVANDSDSFAAQFSPVYGADGQAATPVTYALSTPGGDSGLIDTATGNHVFLFLESGQVVGRQGTDATNAASGDIVFVVGVDASGNVALDQQRAIVHPDTNNFDETKGLSGSNLVVLTATAFDGDGDSASAPLDITGLLKFKDDGIAIQANAAGAPSITDDETAFATNNHANYGGNFTVTLGADGAGATPRSYSLSTPGGDSGLVDTASGNPVFLFKVGDNIVGKAGTDATAAASGPTVFVVSIDQTGEVTLDQQRAVVHVPNTGADQSTTLSSAGLIVINATAFDGDGDHAAASLNIGQLLNFKDDAPTITAQILGGTINFVDDAFVTHSLNGAVNADVITNVNSLSQAGVKEYTITSWSEPHSVYADLDGVLSADGTKVTYYSTSVTANQNASTAVYELTLNQSGAGAYTFTVLQPPPIVQTNFDFTDLPSGQNLMGVIATDKADLTKGGLLVFSNNLDINDGEAGENTSGTMTNESGTVNTSKGGGPVTIGNTNQAFDHPGEGTYFCYVDNPLASAVGGLGLTQVTADDADTAKFNGTNDATTASVEIVQASGSGTAKRPGPDMHIFAYDANPGNVDTDPESRSFLLDPTAGATEVNIIGVKIYDATGKLIEYRTNVDAGATNFGTLQDSDDAGTDIGASDDSLVGIQFVLDNPGGAGTADDIYSTVVSNLKANYTIEFVTETSHDLALVENVSGSFDIGGFNVKNSVNVPAQDFNFSVQISDYDNDVYGGTGVTFANFAVHINDVIF